jgi:hypothetical protein
LAANEISVIPALRGRLGEVAILETWLAGSTRLYATAVSILVRFASALISIAISLERVQVANFQGDARDEAGPPDEITTDERISEIAEILAVGLMRIPASKSSPFSAEHRESLLDCPVIQSGHADVAHKAGTGPTPVN